MISGPAFVAAGLTAAALLLPVSPASSTVAGAAAATCNGRPATIVGTSGHDSITGTPVDEAGPMPGSIDLRLKA